MTSTISNLILYIYKNLRLSNIRDLLSHFALNISTLDLRRGSQSHVTSNIFLFREPHCGELGNIFLSHEDLLTIVKRRKLQWYGHVSRSSGLAKTILQGTVKRERRQGRQRKSWEYNIGEWTGLEFAKSQRAVEKREKWRKLVVKSSVVPQRPSQLTDRWDDERMGFLEAARDILQKRHTTYWYRNLEFHKNIGMVRKTCMRIKMISQEDKNQTSMGVPNKN